MSFVTLLSVDNIEFYLSKEVAQLSPKLKNMIREKEQSRQEGAIFTEFNSDILELVLQYLHYKSRWLSEDPTKVPKFYIQPQKALKVLQAAINLEI